MEALDDEPLVLPRWDPMGAVGCSAFGGHQHDDAAPAVEVARHGGNPARHRLKEHEPEPLAGARHRIDIRQPVGRDLLRLRHHPGEHDATRHAQEEIAKRSAEAESAAQVKVTVMLEEAEKRIAASKTGAEGTSGDPIGSLERSVAQEVVADAVQKLIGVDVTAADIDAAIAETLEGRPQ